MDKKEEHWCRSSSRL